MTTIDSLMTLAPVIPVLVVEDAAHAEPIAEALVAGGLPVLEVTLRTAAALDVIKAMKQVPGAVVGAGTVLNPADLDAALAAGAERAFCRRWKLACRRWPSKRSTRPRAWPCC